MHNFEKKFDPAFDDLFQLPQFMKLFQCQKLDAQAFVRRFSLAFLLGHSVAVPATLLLDHGPARDFLLTKGWADFVFDQNLMQISTDQPSWDELYRVISGKAGQKPLILSTNLEGSFHFAKEWKKDPSKGAYLWEKEFSFVKPLFEKLKVWAPMKSSKVIQGKIGTNYAIHLEAAVNAWGRAYGKSTSYQVFRDRMKGITSRGKALEAIKLCELENQISKDTAAKQRIMVICAKHREIGIMVGAESDETYGDAMFKLGPSSTFKLVRKTRTDRSILNLIIRGSLTLKDLELLAKSSDFIAIRSDYIRASDANAKTKALEELEKCATKIIKPQMSCPTKIMLFLAPSSTSMILPHIIEDLQSTHGIKAAACILLTMGFLLLIGVDKKNEWTANRKIKGVLGGADEE